jgi:tripartite-type tricarboxylate transporter receptor subunit TctC
MNKFWRACIGATMALAAATAFAEYPDKLVKLVVPYPAGGATDAVARIVAAKLQARWGQSVIVENRPGATGAIGTEAVARSAPDGSTLLVAVPLMLSTELVRPAVAYRTLRDFMPVTTLIHTPILFVAGQSAPAGDLKAVLDLGHRDAVSLNYGSHGEGTTSNYLGELLKRTARVSMVHVPYAGEGPVLNDLLGGHIKTGWLSGLGTKKAIASGKARPLAVASRVRTPLLPDVPTFREQGIEGFDRDSWVRVFAPAGTAPAIVERLAHDMGQVLRLPDVQEQFNALGVTAVGGSPAETTREVQLDLAWWKSLIADFGVLAK